MKTTTKPGDNLGGLLKIYAIPKDDVVSIIGMEVTLTSEDNIYELYCSAEPMNFSEVQVNGERGGNYIDINITAFVPKLTEELRDYFQDMMNQRFVVLFRDGNGTYKIAGTTEHPLRFSASAQSGETTASLAGTAITFSGKTTERSVAVNNPITGTGGSV